MNQTRANILLVNYNSENELSGCLNSLLKSSYGNIQIFIVDNCSNPANQESLKQLIGSMGGICVAKKDFVLANTAKEWESSQIILVLNDENAGFGAANNVALAYLLKTRSNEYVGIMNPDLKFEKEVIADLVELAKEDKVIAGNAFYHLEQPDQLDQLGGFKVKSLVHGISKATEISDITNLDSLHGSAIFTKLETFRKVGLFDETYFLYWEETDFCFRARKMGYSLKVNTKSKIFDKGGTEQTHRFIPEYLYIFNGLKFYSKFKPFSMPFVYLSVWAKWLLAVFQNVKLKRRAIFVGLLDFHRFCLGMSYDVRERIKNELEKLTSQ